MSILDYVPLGITLRPIQIEVLKKVEARFPVTDTIVINADTGSGKSIIAKTIANWLETKGLTTAILTPRLDLMDQYLESFTGLPSIRGLEHYHCNKLDTSCANKRLQKRRCKDCPYSKANKEAAESKQAVYNPFLYSVLKKGNRAGGKITNKHYKDVLIIDEAHTLYSSLTDEHTARIWHHEFKYPKNLKTHGDAALWMQKTAKRILGKINNLSEEEQTTYENTILARRMERWDRVAEAINRDENSFFIETTKELYGGIERPCLKISPKTLRNEPSRIWLSSNKCKILMSGTISEIDLKHLGIKADPKNFIVPDAVIPAANRPIIAKDLINMGAKYQTKNAPKLVERLLRLAEQHQGKGLVHVTYGLMSKIKPLLKGNKRFLFHTREDRVGALEKFKNSKDLILVGAGMSEGLDLAGPEYEWQVVAKVIYPSLNDSVVKDWYRNDTDRLNWEIAKWLIQACGRNCRDKDDYGVTYILDSNLGNPVKQQYGFFQKANHLLPDHFKERFVWT